MSSSKILIIVFLCMGPLLFDPRIMTRVQPESDQHLKGQTRTNAIDGSIMVWIPEGEVMMGKAPGEDTQSGQMIQVEGFWLGKYEITNEQYALFLAATDYYEPDFWDDPHYNQSKSPVIGITWDDAIEYCRWAGVRLPTEAEWEYAAAAGENRYRYGTKNGDLNHNVANYSGVEGRDRWEYTSPVGSFDPNPFGLYDMAGNAWEWCSSIMVPYPYSEEQSEDLLSEKELRIMRGGCWYFGGEYCRVTKRHHHRQDLRFDYAGFRVALSDDLR